VRYEIRGYYWKDNQTSSKDQRSVCRTREALRKEIQKELEEMEDDYRNRFDEFPLPECWDGEDE